MPPRQPWGKLTAAQQSEHRERAVAAYRRAGSLRGAETTLRAEGAPYCSFQFVKQAVRRALKAEMGEEAAVEVPREYKRTEDGDTAKVQYLATRPIRTLEDALAYADVDTTVWRVRRWSATAWQSGMKLRTFDDKGKVAAEQPYVQDLWRVSMDLERILPKPWHDATEALIRRMMDHSPTYPVPPVRQRPADPHLLELDLFDVHFGKLAWKPETGNDYDLRIAETVYKNAVLDLLDRAAGFAIDTILLPIGNDFFHVDNHTNTTTAGTPQDVDGRYAKMIEVGTLAVIWAIETLMTVAPVDVIHVPGNHDRLTSLHLAREIAAWFRSCDRVTVDYSPTDR
jgi:hypothetical protein